MSESEIVQTARAIYEAYRVHYDGETNGCCAVVAADILLAVGRGTAVAGYLLFNGTWRPHWWVEIDGELIDPMADDLLRGDYFTHSEEHRDPQMFSFAICDQEQYRLPEFIHKEPS